MFGFGAQELLVVLAIIGLLFGPSLLPKWGRALGQSLREAKNIRKEIQSISEDDDVR